MVFVNSSDACEAVAAEVSRQGLHRVASFHADVDASSRAARLAAFARGELDVLVCTDSAARGVDVPGVTHVVQARPISHWFPYDRVGVVNADP
jgi:superfamily II DNA/RNA helicase